MNGLRLREPIPLRAIYARHFNLWVSTRNTKAPLFSVQLAAACADARLNWALLASIAYVKTNAFRDEKALAAWDWFGLGVQDAPEHERLVAMCAKAVQVAAAHERLEDLPGLTFHEVEKVINTYEVFLRWASAFVNEPLPPPAGLPPKSAPAPTPGPIPPTVPAPAPQPGAPVPAPGAPVKDVPPARAPWLKTLGRVIRWLTATLSFVSALVATVGWLLPPQIAAPIKALLPFLKPLLQALCAHLPECSSIP